LVFLVDDEPVLLDLAEVSLQPAGVLTRKFLDPAQAWRAFQRARPKPQLLISDYSMGKMNGLQLIEKCKTAHPPLKTILVSGNVGAEIILNGPVKIDQFLAKPYPPERLCALAKELLS
jgi:DNA-binding NtrC family response regulator